MKLPRTAIVSIVTVTLTCPNARCGASLPEPHMGSYLWDVGDLPADEIIACPECGQEIVLPRRVSLPLPGNGV